MLSATSSLTQLTRTFPANPQVSNTMGTYLRNWQHTVNTWVGILRSHINVNLVLHQVFSFLFDVGNIYILLTTLYGNPITWVCGWFRNFKLPLKHQHSWVLWTFTKFTQIKESLLMYHCLQDDTTQEECRTNDDRGRWKTTLSWQITQIRPEITVKRSFY